MLAPRVFVTKVEPLPPEPPVDMYANRRKYVAMHKAELKISGDCEIWDRTIQGACDINPKAVAWPPGTWGMDADRIERFEVTDVVFEYGASPVGHWEAVVR